MEDQIWSAGHSLQTSSLEFEWHWEDGLALIFIFFFCNIKDKMLEGIASNIMKNWQA